MAGRLHESRFDSEPGERLSSAWLICGNNDPLVLTESRPFVKRVYLKKRPNSPRVL